MALPNDGFHDELARAFAEYREACPAPELSDGFMPGIWRGIEARRGFSMTVRRISRRFVTAAVALCLLMAILLTIPRTPNAAVGYASSTYLEALATDHSIEDIPITDLEHRDRGVE